MLAFFLSACGGSDGDEGAQPPEHGAEAISNASGTVKYTEGGGLVVNGKIYARGKSTDGNYSKGDLLLGFKPGRKSQATSMLRDFQLPISTYFDALDMMSIKVPVGYEEQWRAALADQPDIVGAYLNEFHTLAN